ncbi:PBS lyase HEAT-like repeat protein, partial [Cooperia oncophora]
MPNKNPLFAMRLEKLLVLSRHISLEKFLSEYCEVTVLNDPCQEIAQTCELALRRIELVNTSGDKTESPYQSIDPTSTASTDNVTELGATLVDKSKPLWDRYSAMFKLRNINTDASIKALAQGLYCEDSALLRHEGCLRARSGTVSSGDQRIGRPNCMVRHECAEALGAIATEHCTSLLQNYVSDEERVVRESCEVAL